MAAIFFFFFFYIFLLFIKKNLKEPTSILFVLFHKKVLIYKTCFFFLHSAGLITTKCSLHLPSYKFFGNSVPWTLVLPVELLFPTMPGRHCAGDPALTGSQRSEISDTGYRLNHCTAAMGRRSRRL